ncbi:MAG: TonB-dependent receptor [bacterium]
MIPLFTLFFMLNQVYEVEGVVVTATRYPASLRDICAGTIVIDKETIENNSPSNLGELLKNLAGIDVKDYGSPGAVSSISIRGTPSSGVIVLMDGIPLNSMQTGIADISLIEVDDVEQIEIIKGPVSSLYGANGIGGVVNIVTQTNKASTAGIAKIRQTSGKVIKPFSSSEYFLNYTIPHKNFDYKLTGKKMSSAGGRTNNDCERFSFRNQFGYNLSHLSVRYQMIFLAQNYGLPGPQPLVDSIHPIPNLGDSTASSRYDYQVDRIWLNDFSIRYQPAKNLSLATKFFGNLQHNQYHTQFQSWGITAEDYEYSLSTLGNNTTFIWEQGLDKYVMGFDIRYDSLRAEKNSLQTGDTLWFARAKNYGYWLTVVKRLSVRFTINPGLRYDHNSSYGDFLSPSLGTVSEINQKFWLKLFLARAFRAPGFNDLYWPIYGNKELKPEHGNAYELRLESSPVYNLFAGFSVFFREINDRITWLPTKDGLWKPQNVNHIKITGFETEINTKLSDYLKISFDGTYLIATQKNQELVYYDFINSEMQFQDIERKSAFIPSLTLSVKFDFHFSENMSLNLSTDYTSTRVNYYENWSFLPVISMDTKTLKGYYLVNLSLRRRFFKHLGLILGVKNLLDTSYSIQFGNSIFDKDYPMSRRTAFGEITWN